MHVHGMHRACAMQVAAVFNVTHYGEECEAKYDRQDGAWRCLFGEYRLPLIRTPYMVIGAQFDTYQLDHDLGQCGHWGCKPRGDAELGYAWRFAAATARFGHRLAVGQRLVYSSRCGRPLHSPPCCAAPRPPPPTSTHTVRLTPPPPLVGLHPLSYPYPPPFRCHRHAVSLSTEDFTAPGCGGLSLEKVYIYMHAHATTLALTLTAPLPPPPHAHLHAPPSRPLHLSAPHSHPPTPPTPTPPHLHLPPHTLGQALLHFLDRPTELPRSYIDEVCPIFDCCCAPGAPLNASVETRAALRIAAAAATGSMPPHTAAAAATGSMAPRTGNMTPRIGNDGGDGDGAEDDGDDGDDGDGDDDDDDDDDDGGGDMPPRIGGTVDAPKLSTVARLVVDGIEDSRYRTVVDGRLGGLQTEMAPAAAVAAAAALLVAIAAVTRRRRRTVAATAALLV